MTFAVEEDEAAAPIGEGVDGGFGITALACGLSKQVEQSGCWRGRGWGGRCWGSVVRVHGCPPGEDVNGCLVNECTVILESSQEK